MIERRLEENSGSNLQGKKPHLPHFLSEIYLDGIRGLDNLRVLFDYPVSVIAGGNATGKSTVLFAQLPCAYKVARATGVRDFSSIYTVSVIIVKGRQNKRRGRKWNRHRF